jgi:hypothetical protein
VQKQIRLEVLAAGADWYLVRTARAAMVALQLSGVKFRLRFKPPRLEPGEGPFADPTQRLLQAPEVAARRRGATRRWREQQRARRAAQQLTTERDAAADDVAA